MIPLLHTLPVQIKQVLTVCFSGYEIAFSVGITWRNCSRFFESQYNRVN